jgi:hypothetical protein
MNPMKVKEKEIFRNLLSDEEYIVKKIVERMVMLESKDGKKQILTEVDTLLIAAFYKKKEE